MRAHWFVLLGLAAAPGCAPDLPELQWFGNYVAFATDWPMRPCGGTLPRMDRFVERTYEFFDRTPLQEPIAVYHLPEAWEDGFPCPEPENHALVSGCAYPSDRTAFFESFSVLEHEIVHVVMVDMASYHDPLFDEGIAEALGSRPAVRLPSNAHVEDMVGWPATAVNYVAAGYFVRSLIDRHGPRAFLAFYQDGRLGMSREDTRASFEQRFGETIEEAAAHYRAREYQCFFELAVCDDEPLVPWQGNEWHYHRSPSCDDEDVWGFNPIEGHEDDREFYFGSVTVGLEIPADGHYEIVPSVGATLRHCGSTCEERETLELGGAYSWQRPYLRAGYYTLQLSATFGFQDTDVTIRRGDSLTEG
jgi:hypothetical protein